MKLSATRTPLTAILRDAGYKATPARIALLSLLQKSKKPLSIQEIMKGMRGSDIDQVTVYRILTVLEQIGAVRKIDLRHGHADYEFVLDDHHHLVCLSCGKIEDFKGCDLDALIKKALKANKSFQKVTQHSLELFGLCAACAKKKG